MLLWNIQAKNVHVNSIRHMVEMMTNNVLFLRVAIGCNNGRSILSLQIPSNLGDDDFLIPEFEKIHFSIRVCFEITTNTAQGLSFSGAHGFNLRPKCLTHVQLYVAFSQKKSPFWHIYLFQIAKSMTMQQPVKCISLFYQRICVQIEFIHTIRKRFCRFTFSLQYIYAKDKLCSIISTLYLHNIEYYSPQSTPIIEPIIYSYLVPPKKYLRPPPLLLEFSESSFSSQRICKLL